MTHDSSPVKLQMASYFEESISTGHAAAETPAPAAKDSSVQVMQTLSRVIGGLLLCGLGVGLALNAKSISAGAHERPKCGVDWLLWAAGSDKTFESSLQAKIERSQRELDRQFDEMKSKSKGMSFQSSDLQPMHWNSPTFGKKK